MNALQTFIQSRPCGFLTEADMPDLIALDRLCPVLVRCGGVRFTCGAQYLAQLIGYVESGGDYVRDVSFPVGSFEAAASWQPERIPASFTAAKDKAAPRPAEPPKPKVPVMRCENFEKDVMHVYVGKNAYTQEDKCCCGGNYHVVRFDESQCGGVYDGTGGVHSDCDPGL